jgi:hypothetical protein
MLCREISFVPTLDPPNCAPVGRLSPHTHQKWTVWSREQNPAANYLSYAELYILCFSLGHYSMCFARGNWCRWSVWIFVEPWIRKTVANAITLNSYFSQQK